jgi:hypothetical protein
LTFVSIGTTTNQQIMNKAKTILISGFIAGSLDGIAAIVLFAHPVNLHNAGNIFRYIASGLIGQGAYSNGVIYPFMGLVLHYLIAVIWSAVYLLFLYRLFKPGNLLLRVVLFTSLIWIVMNGFVVPLSGLGAARSNGWSIMRSFLVLVICVGLPVVLVTEKKV